MGSSTKPTKNEILHDVNELEKLFASISNKRSVNNQDKVEFASYYTNIKAFICGVFDDHGVKNGDESLPTISTNSTHSLDNRSTRSVNCSNDQLAILVEKFDNFVLSVDTRFKALETNSTTPEPQVLNSPYRDAVVGGSNVATTVSTPTLVSTQARDKPTKQKANRPKPIRGKRPLDGGLQSKPPTTHLFVGNLTSLPGQNLSVEVKAYVLSQGISPLDCMNLTSKSGYQSSVFLRINVADESIVNNEAFWPSNVLVRKFMGRNPAPPAAMPAVAHHSPEPVLLAQPDT